MRKSTINTNVNESIRNSNISNDNFNLLSQVIYSAISQGLKNVTLQANVNSYLDGEQLANSLEVAQGRNINLYGRFNL